MLKEDSLKHKVIVITGGGTGLGKAMGKYFVELGADLVIASRKMDVLEATAKELSEINGGNVLPVQCDVTDYSAVENLLKTSVNKFGRVNVLLNNAAGNFISPTERLSNRAFDIIINIVLKGTYNCTLAFGKHWIKEKQKATVLNIVTTYAFTGSAYVVPSAAAKAGVLALTRSLAVEWAKYGIRFNAIAPGPFPTDMLSKSFGGATAADVDWEKVGRGNPRGRFGTPEDIAGLAIFLSSRAGSFTVGEVITCDGGYVRAT